MRFAIAQNLNFFANIEEVTNSIELNFGLCIAYMHTHISTAGFVKILYR